MSCIFASSKRNDMYTATVTEMVATGKYNEAAIAKFHAKQVKVNGGNVAIADAMVRMYKHTFEIRTPKSVS